MIKKYITWNPKKINENVYRHPTSYKTWIPNNVDIIETGYYEESSTSLIEDRLYIGIVECPDDYENQDFDNLKTISGDFKIEYTTPQETITKLNNIYPAPEGEDDYFTLDQDEFTLIDTRPIDEAMI